MRRPLVFLLGLVGFAADFLDRAERRRVAALSCAGCARPGGPLCTACTKEAWVRLAWISVPGSALAKAGLRARPHRPPHGHQPEMWPARGGEA